MEEYCNGNYNAFARELNLNVAHVHRTLTKENSKAGAKFLGALMVFCEKNNLNYKDYIFFPEALTACNTKDKSA
ncbi:MAG: XRE family transcriptional regulator [Firmicutes bacterium]|nr:XRE family transcriptional regulator [Bacillota bacterium]